jgi:hypothetical protein
MRRRRQPMPEITSLLAAVTETDKRVRDTEADLDQARADFREALRKAHDAGASYALLGNLVGLSRQRIGHILAGD